MKYKQLGLACLVSSCVLAGCGTMNDSALAVDPYHYPYNSPSTTMPTDSVFQQFSDGSTPDSNWTASFDNEDLKTKTMHARVMPSSAHQHDRDWVSAQPVNAYTIQIAQHAQSTQVAKVLHDTPKTARMAEVATANGYVGVFGTYQTKEDAAQAMQSLPESIRKEARVTPWQEIHAVD
ncbi:MAG: hypothetical protein NTW08_09215 [Gammaproteobacteria bacterium]|nr:hypothetical protein [Gammaproteobacteria bacterium]